MYLQKALSLVLFVTHVAVIEYLDTYECHFVNANYLFLRVQVLTTQGTQLFNYPVFSFISKAKMQPIVHLNCQCTRVFNDHFKMQKVTAMKVSYWLQVTAHVQSEE